MRQMIKLLFAVCLCIMTNTLEMKGQEKSFTLHDLIPGGKNYSRFVPRDLRQLQWSGNEYIYVKGDSVMAGTPGKSADVAFTRTQLNEALEKAGLSTIGSLPGFSSPNKEQSVLAFTAKKHRLHYDWKKNEIVAIYPLESGWSNYEYCPSTGNLAFTEDNNVRILTPDGKQTAVTEEVADGIVCGQSVHQNEFGIHKGLFWSPAGDALAFYRMDESMVTDYPFVDVSARVALGKPHKYPMAGMKSHEVTLGVYNIATGKTVYLKTGLPKEKYLTNIAWSPDGKSIYIAELNRDQNEMDLVRYSAETGAREAVLFSEKHDKYVEPQQPVLFLPNQIGRAHV